MIDAELRHWVMIKKLATWEIMKKMTNATPKERRDAGYPGYTREEAIASIFKEALQGIAVKLESEGR